jgi:hypothetical protein
VALNENPVDLQHKILESKVLLLKLGICFRKARSLACPVTVIAKHSYWAGKVRNDFSGPIYSSSSSSSPVSL